MTTEDDLHTTAAQRLRDAGLRYSAARRGVVQVLDKADRPLTIPEILQRDRSLAQSSTYRNLTELISSGVVHRIVSGEEYSHYELAEELTSHHHHLLCTSCGRVEDFAPSQTLESTLEESLEQVARAHGFTSEHHRLDLIGICSSCSG